MWIPEVQVEDILTGTEGGGHILVDYAVSQQKDMRVQQKLLPYEFPKKKWIQAPNSKSLFSFHALVLTFSVIVSKLAAPVDEVTVHTIRADSSDPLSLLLMM